MNNFSYQRFINVARWDLTINRPFYLKAALLIFLVMAFPLIGSMFSTVWSMLFGYYTPPTYVSCVANLAFFLTMMPFVCGYTFHNLLTKQSRISELTLPATHCEKFLWHALLTFFGPVLIALASLFTLDLVQMLYVGMLAGFGQVESSVAHLWGDLHDIFRMMQYVDYATAMYSVIVLSYILGCSIFVLGNAAKYKLNIILTMLASGLVSFIMLLAFACLNVGWLHRFPESLVITLFYAIPIVLIVASWMAAYCLYCRAQVTSRRNK